MTEDRIGKILISSDFRGPLIVGEIVRVTPTTWKIAEVDHNGRPRTVGRKKRPDDLVVATREEAIERLAAWKEVWDDYWPAIEILQRKERQLSVERSAFARAALTRHEPAFAFQRGERENPVDPEELMEKVFGNGGRRARDAA